MNQAQTSPRQLTLYFPWRKGQREFQPDLFQTQLTPREKKYVTWILSEISLASSKDPSSHRARFGDPTLESTRQLQLKHLRRLTMRLLTPTPPSLRFMRLDRARDHKFRKENPWQVSQTAFSI